MEDHADEEIDTSVAETSGLAYVEAQEYQFGDRDELDRLERDVSVAVGRAWIAYAREHVHPVLPRGLFERIQEWYATDARQLNHDFSSGEGSGRMPVPVTARAIATVIRLSVAFSRAHLRDEVAPSDVDRAIELQKQLIGQTFTGERFEPQETRPSSQRDRVTELLSFIGEQESKWDNGVPITSIESLAVNRGLDMDQIRHDIDKLSQQGKLTEPKTDHWRTT